MDARRLGLACLLLGACCAEASARCSVPFIPTFDNQTVNARITVSSGAQCSIKLQRSPGPIYSAHIVQRPTNGTVTVDSSNRIVYRSRPRYVGSDSFTYARRGENTRGNPITRTVRVHVTVTP